MAGTPSLVIYTLEFCPNCDTLKEYLARNKIPFTERDLSTAESLTELRINGVFVNEAPVLQNAEVFLTSTDLFSGGRVREETMIKLLEGS